MIKDFLKQILRGLSLLTVSPLGFACWLESRFRPSSESLFCLCAQTLSLVPGVFGVYLRRAFYQCTLDQCANDVFLGFGTIFSHRQARVESQVYVGSYALIGAAVLRRRCMIGSRASLLSGGHLHRYEEEAGWTSTDMSQLQQIEIGENAWLGEAVVVMADVGPRAMVSAGAVVSNPVPGQIMVGGNPARFIRKVQVIEPLPAETGLPKGEVVSEESSIHTESWT